MHPLYRLVQLVRRAILTVITVRSGLSQLFQSVKLTLNDPYCQVIVQSV